MKTQQNVMQNYYILLIMLDMFLKRTLFANKGKNSLDYLIMQIVSRRLRTERVFFQAEMGYLLIYKKHEVNCIIHLLF